MDGVELVRLLGEKYNFEILCEMQEPKTVKEVSEEVDIPIATSYRRIDDLLESELLEIDGKTISENGGTVKVYKSNVEELHLYLDNEDGFDIEVVESEREEDKLVSVWNEL